MHTQKNSFASSLSPGEILARFWELSAEMQWAAVAADEASAHAQSGPTLRSAGENIRVSTRPRADGTQVDLMVSSRFGVLQAVDWGEAAAFHRTVLDRLGGPDSGLYGRLDDGVRDRPVRGAVPAPRAARPGTAGAVRAIEVSRLRKAYGGHVAVDDVSFSVAEGEIFGLLGPNGAGKTTTVECTVGLRSADSGQVRVLGLDPARDRAQLRLAVGVQLQSSTLPDKLKVGELLDLYSSFYPDPADADELALTLGLAGKRDEYFKSLSGGQKQRVSIALALIGRPQVAVLDEMTTGLDPHARRETWELIEKVRDRGVTILLVTHSMEEAERLCDEVALLDQGRIVATGTPEQLTRQVPAGRQLHFTPSRPFDDQMLTGLPEVTGIARDGQRVHVTGTGDLVSVVIQALAAGGVTAHDVELTSATLEDAFVKLTGRPLASAPPARRLRGRRHRPAHHERRPLLPKGTPRRAFAKLTQAEARLARRQPIGLAVGLAAPVLVFALLGSAFRGPNKSLGGLSVAQAEFPVMIVFVLAVLAFFSLPLPLAGYREQGFLRRLSTTPVPPAWVLGAQLVINACIAAAGIAILVVIGVAGFGIGAPRSLGGFALAMVLVGLAALSLGLLIAGTARTRGAAGGFGILAWYGLMFFAGLFLPRQELPSVVDKIGDWTPLGAGVEALQHAMRTGFPSASPLLALAGYAVVCGSLAVRYFRWE